MPNVYCDVDTCEFSDCGKCQKDTVQVDANSNSTNTDTSDCTACSSYSAKKC